MNKSGGKTLTWTSSVFSSLCSLEVYFASTLCEPASPDSEVVYLIPNLFQPGPGPRLITPSSPIGNQKRTQTLYDSWELNDRQEEEEKRLFFFPPSPRTTSLFTDDVPITSCPVVAQNQQFFFSPPKKNIPEMVPANKWTVQESVAIPLVRFLLFLFCFSFFFFSFFKSGPAEWPADWDSGEPTSDRRRHVFHMARFSELVHLCRLSQPDCVSVQRFCVRNQERDAQKATLCRRGKKKKTCSFTGNWNLIVTLNNLPRCLRLLVNERQRRSVSQLSRK